MKNTISNTDDIIDSRDVIERIEELEESCINYTNGWNLTGCLCDSEPAGFQDFETAKNSILETLQSEADYTEDESKAEAIEAYIQDINLESDEFSVFVEPLNYWYWVAKGDGMPEDPDEAAELTALRDLAEQASGYAPDWGYGESLIRDSYFIEYAQQLAEDIGAINSDASWPNTCIDWEQAARELQMDYTSVEFDGVDYWIR